MSNKLIHMHLVSHIVLSLQREISQRKIARDLGLSCNIVKLYASRIENSGHGLEALQQLDGAALSCLVYPLERPVLADSRKDAFTSRYPISFPSSSIPA